MASTRMRSVRGEFLLMLLIAVAIIGILAGILAPVLANKLDDARMRAEVETLRSLRTDFEATYDSTDFGSLNEASVASSGLPTGTVFTTFDQMAGATSRIYSQTIEVDPAGWVTKLAKKRGVSSYTIGATYTALSQNQYSSIAFNAYKVQRCLLIGPANEAGQQRYLLISLMVPPYRMLVLPTDDSIQDFDSIWDQDWESAQVQTPASWSSSLSTAQITEWNVASENNRTNASRLLIERIIQPKFTLTLANNSPTDTAWIDIGPTTNAIVAAPNTGTVQSASLPGFTTGILSGRLIVVRRGQSTTSAFEVQRFFLYSDVNVTVQ